ncbi:MAG: flavin reductase family protein [Oscillospiraceae bacterium]|nr:flavin reductase family protein [Oscillospiraceae bacterium]MBQ8978248.1 flavin reductase family protein [Oscillospiraceae bacterium]
MRRELGGGTVLAPVPAVLVTCSYEGRRNVFTVGWTGIVNTRPPMLYISVRPERFSYEMIDKSGEFVVNLTTSAMVKAVDLCGNKSGRDADKFALCRLDTQESEKVSAPIIAASPLALECRVNRRVELGSHTMFIADIVGMSADERFLDSKGKLNLEQAGLMAYAHGQYSVLGKGLGRIGYSVRKRK